MNPFRRPSVRYGKTPAPETPYQKAAQVWDERIGSARVQARNWRLIARYERNTSILRPSTALWRQVFGKLSQCKGMLWPN